MNTEANDIIKSDTQDTGATGTQDTGTKVELTQEQRDRLTTEYLDIRMLKAASLFASKDESRPILGSIQVIHCQQPDGKVVRYYVATDPYGLIVATNARFSPSKIISDCQSWAKRNAEIDAEILRTEGHVDHSRQHPMDPTIPAKLIAPMLKSAGVKCNGHLNVKYLPKLNDDGKPIGGDMFRRLEASWVDGGSTVTDITDLDWNDGDFPNFAQLLSSDDPGNGKACFNPDYMERTAKAFKVIIGNGRDAKDTPMTWHGGLDALKPAYASVVTGNGSAVSLLMPVRAGATAGGPSQIDW